jgi:tripartite-type tricarboxylate transporter receptor subunit TctC
MKRLALAILLAMFPLAKAALAQSFPERPITLVNPYAAGGPADLLARTVAEGMSEALGRPVVVENRPGAGTAVGARAVAQAKPDGYTLFIGGSPSHVITPALMKDAGYDGIKSFVPIATVADVPNVLIVPPGRPYKSVPELVAAARGAGGNMTFATVGVGSIPQFLGILLQLRADVKLIEVPYKGGAPAAVAVAAGEVPFGMAAISSALPQIKAGRVKVLAITTARKSSLDTSWPTVQEAGVKDVDLSIWAGLFAPKGVPQPIRDKLYTEVAAILQMPDVKEKFAAGGTDTGGMKPEEFTAQIKREAEKLKSVVQTAGIKPE